MKLEEHSLLKAYMSAVNEKKSSTTSSVCGINFLLIMDCCFSNDLQYALKNQKQYIGSFTRIV